MIQSQCQVQHLFHIGPGAFRPPPRVDSAMVSLRPYPVSPYELRDPDGFARLVKAAFAQRRKSLANGLKGLLSREAIAACGIDPGIRAERLSVAEFVTLSNALANGSDR
jgi:16S rRNA (adenine1518-N6/adenine1519-N6)-dimethyltransferase